MIKSLLVIYLLTLLTGCSSSSSTSGTGIQVDISHVEANTPAVTQTLTPGKSFTTDQGTLVEITQAYLTISEISIRTDCVSTPFAFLFESILETIIPSASAHTESTPTSIGESIVINIMADDASVNNFGTFSPPADSYCGVTVFPRQADSIDRNLPTTVGFTGVVLLVSGNYTPNGEAETAFNINITTELEPSDVTLPSDITLSAANLTGSIDINIEYNTWFEGIDIALLETGVTTEVDKFRTNVTTSIKHLP